MPLLAAHEGPDLRKPARQGATSTAQTRDIVHDMYIRKVEKKDGQLWNIEFDVQKGVKDPGKLK